MSFTDPIQVLKRRVFYIPGLILFTRAVTASCTGSKAPSKLTSAHKASRRQPSPQEVFMGGM